MVVNVDVGLVCICNGKDQTAMRPSTCGVDASRDLLTVSVLERRLSCRAKGVSAVSMPQCIKAHCISKLLSIKPE